MSSKRKLLSHTRRYFVSDIENLHAKLLLLHDVLLVQVVQFSPSSLATDHLAQRQFDVHQVVVVGMQILRMFLNKTLTGFRIATLQTRQFFADGPDDSIDIGRGFSFLASGAFPMTAVLQRLLGHQVPMPVNAA